MKLSSCTLYYTVELKTAETLLVKATELIHDTLEEELHEFHSLPTYVRTENQYGKDLYDEIQFLNSLVIALKNNTRQLQQILPRKEAPNG